MSSSATIISLYNAVMPKRYDVPLILAGSLTCVALGTGIVGLLGHWPRWPAAVGAAALVAVAVVLFLRTPSFDWNTRNSFLLGAIGLVIAVAINYGFALLFDPGNSERAVANIAAWFVAIGFGILFLNAI